MLDSRERQSLKRSMSHGAGQATGSSVASSSTGHGRQFLCPASSETLPTSVVDASSFNDACVLYGERAPVRQAAVAEARPIGRVASSSCRASVDHPRSRSGVAVGTDERRVVETRCALTPKRSYTGHIHSELPLSRLESRRPSGQRSLTLFSGRAELERPPARFIVRPARREVRAGVGKIALQGRSPVSYATISDPIRSRGASPPEGCDAHEIQCFQHRGVPTENTESCENSALCPDDSLGTHHMSPSAEVLVEEQSPQKTKSTAASESSSPGLVATEFTHVTPQPLRHRVGSGYCESRVGESEAMKHMSGSTVATHFEGTQDASQLSVASSVSGPNVRLLSQRFEGCLRPEDGAEVSPAGDDDVRMETRSLGHSLSEPELKRSVSPLPQGRMKEERGAILEMMLSMYDSRLSSLEEVIEKRWLVQVDVQKQKEECDDLCHRYEALAAEALEFGCSRDTPGAMEVFANSTTALGVIAELRKTFSDIEREQSRSFGRRMLNLISHKFSRSQSPLVRESRHRGSHRALSLPSSRVDN